MSACSPEKMIADIKTQGWLQCDLVAGEALRAYLNSNDIEGLGGIPDYWLLITHSCSVQNNCLTKVPNVEWIAIRKITGKKANSSLTNAHNPRIYHLSLPPEPARCHLEIKIEQRVWCSRCALRNIADQRITHVVELNLQAKKNIAYWVSHSYNRISLPTELVNRLRSNGISPCINSFLEEHGDLISSAWIRFDPIEEIQDTTTPYEIEFRFLMKTVRRLNDVQAVLNKRISDITINNSEITLVGVNNAVKPLSGFTMLDAEVYTRYNELDWISLADE